MQGGIFVTLYDEKTLALYLKYGIYGFLMKPVMGDTPSNKSRHYNALADYACNREGAHIFFFLKRKIVYGGTITGNHKDETISSFYLNGKTSPLGRKANAPLFWDESHRYSPTKTQGIFIVNNEEKAQPFILKFNKSNNLTGKTISSDDLYFELGKFPYPLPSNTIKGMSFCTLTPGETNIAIELLNNSNKYFTSNSKETITIGEEQSLFNSSLITDREFQNEAQLEFMLLADIRCLQSISFVPKDSYILCRQVPISPYKPYNMDRADICLYSLSKPIGKGTIPNIIIELKKDKANFEAYNQVVRYLDWIYKCTSDEDFDKIIPLIIAPDFHINPNKILQKYQRKIKMYSLNNKEPYELPLPK